MRLRRKLNPSQITLFWRQLATLLRSGMPLPDALAAVGRDSETENLLSTAETLRAAVLQGAPLSEAIGSMGAEFDAGTVACIRSGERTGDLPGAVSIVASYGEKVDLLRLRGRMVLVYPVILFAFTALVCWTLLQWVVPVMTSFYQSFKTPLPWPFYAAILSLRVLYLAVLAALLIGFLGAGIRRFPWISPALGRIVDRSLFTIPLWGRFYRSLVLARFTRLLTLLLRSKVPLHEALTLAGRASGNTALESETTAAATAVKDGARASASLRAGSVFTATMLWALRIAEERGDLEETLGGLAEYFDETASIGASTFLTAVEPLAVAVVGLLCAASLIALTTPMVTIYKLFE